MANRIYDRHVLAGFGVVVKRQIRWGQSPGIITGFFPASVNETIRRREMGIEGHLDPGDRIRFLVAQLPDDGVTRVEVRPVDGRKVGNSQDRVWIRWPSDGRRVRGLFRIDEAAP